MKHLSIKSKMTLALILFILAQALLLILLSQGAYNRYERLVVHDYRSKFGMEVGKINSTVVRLEEDAKDLALVGEVFHRFVGPGTVNDGFMRKTLVAFMDNRDLGAGAGVWYEPYALDDDRELACYFLYRRNGQLVFDAAYLSNPLNYLHQDWYRTLAADLTQKGGRRTAWTKPYDAKTGAKTRMVTVGCGIRGDADDDDGGKLVGLATIDWNMWEILQLIESMRITGDSFTLLADPANDYILASNDPRGGAQVGASLKSVEWYGDGPVNEGDIVYGGVHYMSFVGRLDNGMVVVANVPQWDMFKELRHTLMALAAAYTVAAAAATVLMYSLLNRFVHRPVSYLSEKALAIGGGNLDTDIHLDSGDELGSLADSFSAMTTNLKRHVENLKAVTAERERIGAELNIAKEIQVSFLPRTFPAFPGRNDFDLHARMDPAREVGGDFYDFFLVDDDHLAVVVADVSGKGVPAALYMVVAKTLVNNHARRGLNVARVLDEANRQLCENEDMGMFVTAFLGVLDLRTGRLAFANAGHNPPIMLRRGEKAAVQKVPADIVLGVLEDTKYREGELTLRPGDAILLYTDGVTEADNPAQEMFGMDRLLESAERHRSPDGAQLRELLGGIRADVDAFADGAAQYDDITLLAVGYHGRGGS